MHVERKGSEEKEECVDLLTMGSDVFDHSL
jgi:hypothetical protein